MSRRRALGLSLLASLLALTGCSQGDPPAKGHRDDPSTPPTSARASATASAGRPPAVAPIRSTFFGMHDGRVTAGTVPDAPVGALRFWDSGTTWRDLEPSPGRYEWSGLDTAVAAAEEAQARPLLVLGQTPDFYASRPHQIAAYGPGAASMPDLGAWRRYVTAVAQRYGTRIDYQVWNEADVTGYWGGTPRQMAELTVLAGRAIHRVAPRATVVAPPFVLRLPSQQRYFQDFWSLQAHGLDLDAAVDVAALNLYPSAEEPPEGEIPLYDLAARTLEHVGADLPVWNTEINYGLLGGPAPPTIPLERQRAFVMRTYLLNAGLGVPRVYWYRWDLDPIANTLLTEQTDRSTPNLAGRSIATLRAWLLGASVEPCESSGGVWQCKASKGGETLTFWWKQSGAPDVMTAPEEARSWTDADGTVTRCQSPCRVRVGQTPVLVTSR